jgi:hypothetical protein
MAVCADALCYILSEKARQDAQHLGEQVVESRMHLPRSHDGGDGVGNDMQDLRAEQVRG